MKSECFTPCLCLSIIGFNLITSCAALHQKDAIRDFVSERFDDGAPKTIVNYEDNDSTKLAACIRSFAPDSLLIVMEVPNVKFKIEYEYFGLLASGRYSLVPQDRLEAFISSGQLELRKKSFIIYLDGEKVAYGAGTPNHRMRLNSYALEAERISSAQFELLGAIYALPNLFSGDDSLVNDVSIKYVETDFRDANNVVFVKYKFKKEFNIEAFPRSHQLSNNDENDISLMRGNNLAVPDNWNGFMVADDLTWIDPESQFWISRPAWWVVEYSDNGNAENTLFGRIMVPHGARANTFTIPRRPVRFITGLGVYNG